MNIYALNENNILYYCSLRIFSYICIRNTTDKKQYHSMNLYRTFSRIAGGLVAVLILTTTVGCEKEPTTTPNEGDILFTSDGHVFGVVDSEEWFEIPITATHATEQSRTIGVEVIAAKSSAMEGYDFELASHTLTIEGGRKSATLRLRGIAENFDHNTSKSIALRLVLNPENIANNSSIETTVVLQHCCPFDINNFEGYAVLTSTWCMQYMNSNSRLVHTHAEDEGIVVIEDMLYDGYDIRVKLNTEEIINPTALLCDTQVLGSTGDAFGTIYGDGKILITEASKYNSASADLSGYISFYSTCENFMMLYTVMYVEGVGEIGMFGNILEWVSDDEAERIMREGL